MDILDTFHTISTTSLCLYEYEHFISPSSPKTPRRMIKYYTVEGKEKSSWENKVLGQMGRMEKREKFIFSISIYQIEFLNYNFPSFSKLYKRLHDFTHIKEYYISCKLLINIYLFMNISREVIWEKKSSSPTVI